MRLLRAMSPGRRMEIAAELSEMALALAEGGIRVRHPDYDDQQVTWALRRLRLGDELFQRVWPAAPMLAS